MVCTFFGNATVVSETQFSNIPLSICSIRPLIATRCKEVHLAKQYSPTDVVLLGITTIFRDVHPENA